MKAFAILSLLASSFLFTWPKADAMDSCDSIIRISSYSSKPQDQSEEFKDVPDARNANKIIKVLPGHFVSTEFGSANILVADNVQRGFVVFLWDRDKKIVYSMWVRQEPTPAQISLLETLSKSDKQPHAIVFHGSISEGAEDFAASLRRKFKIRRDKIWSGQGKWSVSFRSKENQFHFDKKVGRSITLVKGFEK